MANRKLDPSIADLDDTSMMDQVRTLTAHKHNPRVDKKTLMQDTVRLNQRC